MSEVTSKMMKKFWGRTNKREREEHSQHRQQQSRTVYKCITEFVSCKDYWPRKCKEMSYQKEKKPWILPTGPCKSEIKLTDFN